MNSVLPMPPRSTFKDSKSSSMSMIILALIPLSLPIYILKQLLFTKNNNPLQIIYTWIRRYIILTFTKLPGDKYDKNDKLLSLPPPPVSSQLLAYVIVSIFGYLATDRLIPIIKKYTLRKGISGKDLGKRGTDLENKDV